MPRIAFLDVDMTLVDNKTGAYNLALIQHLVDNQFDAVYLVTGRNANDCWQHVFQLGRNVPALWRNSLLFNVVKALEDRGIPVAGVSTPYDHYFLNLQAELADENRTIPLESAPWHVRQAGEAVERFYIPFEVELAALEDRLITQARLLGLFRKFAPGNYPDGTGATDSLDAALPMYMSITEDTEKKGQFNCLLDRIKNDFPMRLAADFQIFFWDDKVENLRAAQEFFRHKGVAIQTEEVLSVSEFRPKAKARQDSQTDDVGNEWMTFFNADPQMPPTAAAVPPVVTGAARASEVDLDDGAAVTGSPGSTAGSPLNAPPPGNSPFSEVSVPPVNNVFPAEFLEKYFAENTGLFEAYLIERERTYAWRDFWSLKVASFLGIFGYKTERSVRRTFISELGNLVREQPICLEEIQRRIESGVTQFAPRTSETNVNYQYSLKSLLRQFQQELNEIASNNVRLDTLEVRGPTPS